MPGEPDGDELSPADPSEEIPWYGMTQDEWKIFKKEYFEVFDRRPSIIPPARSPAIAVKNVYLAMALERSARREEE